MHFRVLNAVNIKEYDQYQIEIHALIHQKVEVIPYPRVVILFRIFTAIVKGYHLLCTV